MSIAALREKRATAIQQARSIYDAAQTENRATTEDETRRFDAFMAESETLRAQIERMERLEAEERALGESQGRRTLTPDTRTETGDALRSWLVSGKGDLAFDLRSKAPRTLDSASWEKRALSFAAGAGAELVPEGFVNALEVALLTFGGMRQVASVIRTDGGQDLPWPTTNDTMNEGEILGVNATVNEQDLVFSEKVLKAYKYSSRLIRVPVELIQDSAVNLAEYVGAALGERIGRITNRHFTVGTGVSQPQGIITGATLGVTGATGQTTTVTYEDLVDLEHSVDAAYRIGAKFMFADTTLAKLKKLRDNDGKLIWQPSMVAGTPDRILGYEYVINNAVPAMAADAKSIVFGDLSKYKIRDAQGVILRRLDERYADAHQVGFLAFSRHDGLLLDAGTAPVKFYQNAAA